MFTGVSVDRVYYLKELNHGQIHNYFFRIVLFSIWTLSTQKLFHWKSGNFKADLKWLRFSGTTLKSCLLNTTNMFRYSYETSYNLNKSIDLDLTFLISIFFTKLKSSSLRYLVLVLQNRSLLTEPLASLSTSRFIVNWNR